jgi:hypothetical protein
VLMKSDYKKRFVSWGRNTRSHAAEFVTYKHKNACYELHGDKNFREFAHKSVDILRSKCLQ